MPTLVNCPACERKLRVPDNLLGKKVKCPGCLKPFTAGEAPADELPAEEPPAEEGPGGGGSPWSGLDKVSERPSRAGRRAAPQEEEAPPEEEERPSRRRRDEEDEGQEEERPSRRRRDEEDEGDEEDRPRRRRRLRGGLQPHRGGLILALGIVSITCGVLALTSVCCSLALVFPLAGLPTGTIAWILGHKDLALIRAREMDPTGEGTTKGGWICGLIGTIVNALALIGCGALVILVLVFNITAGPQRKF